MEAGRTAFVFATLLLLASLIPIFAVQNLMPQGEGVELIPESSETTGSSTSITDIPEWRIGDTWIYDGYLDVSDFIAGSGVSTSVETLDGTLEMSVVDSFEIEIDNNLTWSYQADSTGSYSSGVISLDGVSGCLFVDMETTEILRASDLATYFQGANIDVYFDPFFLGECRQFLRQEIGLLTVGNQFNPPLENYDFPLNVGEAWESNYDQETNFSGSSEYVDIPEDYNDSNSTSWEIVSRGSSGVTFAGCQQSFNITNYDSEGEESGYNWYCPSIRGNIKSSLVQTFGFLAVHELVSYSSVQRGKQISIDLEYPLSPIDIESYAWINVTNNGQPLANQTLQFRYESNQLFQNITTDSQGTYQFYFNTGNKSDDTYGSGELGSHGILALMPEENVLGINSIILDSNIHEIDLVTRSEGVLVHRTRENSTLTLDSSVGFSSIRGDTLSFSVPVMNRGLLKSPQASLQISVPDGSSVTGVVPPLESLEESRIEINWTVPESQEFGNAYFDIEADPDGEISEDGNRSNNIGSFLIYIGELPYSSFNIVNESLTMEQVLIDGSESFDPDGGAIQCEFRIEKSDGQTFTSIQEDCVFEWIWSDDGIFNVSLFVTDEENDASTSFSEIMIHNRPPVVTISADAEESPVFSPITFRVENRSDIDSMTPSSPIDFLWNASCEEGRVSLSCTISPTMEGVLSLELIATDDDGDKTYANYSIDIINVPPSNPQSEIWFGPNRLTEDSRGVFIIDEGDQITLVGRADDTSNDIESLVHIWTPDAEYFPEFNNTSVGIRSIVNHTYNSSGMHLATLVAIDDDGAKTETLIIPIQVENVPPTISSITPVGTLEEDQLISIEGTAKDTQNDISSLSYCFDLSPDEDSDADGSPTNDCNIESSKFDFSWPDASTAPEFIIFHVSDDDGATDSVDIQIQIENAPPTALASINLENPQQGEKITLTANGTVDSEVDMDSLIYHWDIDIETDSDGDGDPSNDIDYEGRWIEFSYSDGGKKQAKLTVSDESTSHSVTMEILVSRKSSNLSMNTVIPSFIIIASIVIFFLYRKNTEVLIRKDSSEGHQNPSDSASSQLSLEKNDFMFRDQYQEFLESNEKIEKETPKLSENDLNSQFENTLPNNILDDEDIEALFD